jgi:tetratricopeptide (TPR) repeat protein
MTTVKILSRGTGQRRSAAGNDGTDADHPAAAALAGAWLHASAPGHSDRAGLDVIAKGELHAAETAFVESVLKRLAETTGKGDFDAGAKAVDDALATLDRQATDQRQTRKALLEAGVEHDFLRRDAAAVARRIEAIAALDSPDAIAAWSQTYWHRFNRFFAEGQDKSDSLSLEAASEMARRMAATGRNADERGAAFMLLGNTLKALGELESGTERLRLAVAAYRDALMEAPREKAPLSWAAAKTGLAAALAMLGEREGGTERLMQAAAAYREALQETTRARGPLHWAAAQVSLGNVLMVQGERESGTGRLKDAVAAYREALTEQLHYRVPRVWAATQVYLGSALYRLGEREEGTVRLEEAAIAFREALKENTREREPLQWAMTKNNLGLALALLGERENGTAHLEEAATSYREALQEYPRARLPLDWASTKNNLGLVLMVLGQRQSGTQTLEDAVTAFREALQEFTRERVPPQWSATQLSLGAALTLLGEREEGTALLEEAAAAIHESLRERPRDRMPVRWAVAKLHLAELSLGFYNKTAKAQHLDVALEKLDAALAEFCKAKAAAHIETAKRLRETVLAAKRR